MRNQWLDKKQQDDLRRLYLAKAGYRPRFNAYIATLMKEVGVIIEEASMDFRRNIERRA